MSGGLIIDLPLIGIKDTLTQMISIGNLLSDEEMVQVIEYIISQQRRAKRNDIENHIRP